MSQNKSKKKTKKKERREKYLTEVDWKSQTDRLIRFCNKKGFIVRVEKCDQGCSTICFDNNEISLHNGLIPERIFYNLVHEMGHMLIHENPQEYSQNVGFVANNFHEHSMTKKFGEIEEEFDAWKVGYKQAKKMRFKIDRIEFEKIKASYLSTYLEWGLQRKINKRIKWAIKKHRKNKDNV